MPRQFTILEKDQAFYFNCSPQVPCFNACCRDLNQIIAPYDILCLKHFLEMTSTEFLAAYTETAVGPGSGLPVVSLRFGDADDLACPFVSTNGCRVYPARPASCRTYPLARGVARNRENGGLTEQWALIREPHCRGFSSGQRQTAAQWVHDQQIATHNRMNDMMLELIFTKNRFRPGPLKPDEHQQVFTALYDLDAFRDHRPADFSMPQATPPNQADKPSLAGDIELLNRAVEWICTTVFAVPK